MPLEETSPDALDLPRWWEEHSELDQMVAGAIETLAHGTLEAALAAFSSLEETLHGHFSVEETIYFPLIERFSPNEIGAVRAACRGHDRIRNALDQVQDLLSNGDRRDARRALVELLAGFREHEQHEDQLIERLRNAATESSNMEKRT